MNAFKLWLAELKHIGKNRKVFISFIAVLLIPLIYSGMFLWAFWNPYGSMDQLPVAIVNSDEGAQFNDRKLDVGKEFVDNLEDSGDFKYELVSKEEGYEGLSNHEFYMLVEIPENFSSSATTILDDNPKKLQLKYVPNEGFNFLSAQIGESATEQMKAELADEMTKTYARAMFTKFDELKAGLADASSKAEDLNAGAEELDSGAATLEDKLHTFTDKQSELKNGAQDLQEGASQVTSGANDLSDGLGSLDEGYSQLLDGASQSKDGADQLQQGLSQSKEGASQLEQGLGELAQQSSGLTESSQQLVSSLKSMEDGTNQVSDSASSLSDGMSRLKENLAPVIAQLPKEQQQKIQAQLAQLNEGASKLAGASSDLAQGSAQMVEETQSMPDKVASLSDAHSRLHQGAEELNTAQTNLYNGASSLAEGEEQLLSGMQTFDQNLGSAAEGATNLAEGAAEMETGTDQLSSGSKQLTDGSQELAKGAGDLSEGTNELTSGTSEFESNLSEASSNANNVQTSEKTEEMFAKPVDLDTNSVNEVPNYGTGFTPYFLSLGLFVGALLITIVFPVRNPVAAPKNARSWFFAKFGVLVGAGIVQAIVACSVILYGLGLEVESVLYFYLFSVITSLTFMGIIQLLVTTLGDPGRFIGILILIMQLTTSAGTFPLELIPAPLQILNPILPMTYSVEGLKAVVSEGNYELMWQDSGILAIFLLGSVVLTMAYFIVSFKKRHPLFRENAA
ncbi:YhgE/Pip domain-containing protein [Halobacillus halophilus]|uniref:YhgE/Pip domain-containing protein n=1 Tax=Halobacillus halophilus TaxID=1570 RepID=UPI001CD4397F|nr:YhgE/Pip domain-containing protein [Halobacillus halophilus]MCA1011612.1 YhgE/Pip domain-containing protein [Halobacillus halophilus]